MLIRLMESFGVKIGSFEHVLEGYKVADEMAAHGAAASTFSDWWAYKFEVYDAIPYNGSLLRDRGALVVFNSDSSDLARRLYTEAAKAVKYGGTPEVEALKFVTLNPAKLLRIDQRVGSLEPGKDADVAIWSRSPLDSRTVCRKPGSTARNTSTAPSTPNASPTWKRNAPPLWPRQRRSPSCPRAAVEAGVVEMIPSSAPPLNMNSTATTAAAKTTR